MKLTIGFLGLIIVLYHLAAFAITDINIYVPVVTLSTKDKYKTKINAQTIQTHN